MEQDELSINLFGNHVEARHAVQSISRSGFNTKNLSLIGIGYHNAKRPVDFYAAGVRIKSWDGIGGLWGELWSLLPAPGVFFLSGLGLTVMAGPVASAMEDVFEKAVETDGAVALHSALAQIGVPNDDIIKYTMALGLDNYVFMVHGSAEDVKRARSAIAISNAWETAYSRGLVPFDTRWAGIVNEPLGVKRSPNRGSDATENSLPYGIRLTGVRNVN